SLVRPPATSKTRSGRNDVATDPVKRSSARRKWPTGSRLRSTHARLTISTRTPEQMHWRQKGFRQRLIAPAPGLQQAPTPFFPTPLPILVHPPLLPISRKSRYWP